MGYLKPAIYDILPAEPYRIVRSCSCRSEKCVYKCTNKIRINVNGKRLDI